MYSADLLSRETARNSVSEKRVETGNLGLPYSRELYNSVLSAGVTEFGRSGLLQETSFIPIPCPSIYSSESHSLLTKPKLLRKKEAELGRCKEQLLKRNIDCANAVCGERFAVEREAELRRRLRNQQCEFEGMKRVERLRNRERLLCETERLRSERDEAHIQLAVRDTVIKRLKIRVRQLEQVEKQRQAEIGQMKRELETKNTTLKNLLRKLVLVQFSKKKS